MVYKNDPPRDFPGVPLTIEVGAYDYADLPESPSGVPAPGVPALVMEARAAIAIATSVQADKRAESEFRQARRCTRYDGGAGPARVCTRCGFGCGSRSDSPSANSLRWLPRGSSEAFDRTLRSAERLFEYQNPRHDDEPHGSGRRAALSTERIASARALGFRGGTRMPSTPDADDLERASRPMSR